MIKHPEVKPCDRCAAPAPVSLGAGNYPFNPKRTIWCCGKCLSELPVVRMVQHDPAVKSYEANR